jgi:hypothetical protein
MSDQRRPLSPIETMIDQACAVGIRREPWRPAVPDPRTVDGVPVKLGDRVWFWRGWGSPNRRALNKVDLGMWWVHMTSKQIYSTERAALDAAIADERDNLKKARQRARKL